MASTPPERKVHISRTEESSIDREFKSMRERFDEEMKKMEEDMNRFRLCMQEKEKGTTISKSTSSSSSSSYTSSRQQQSSSGRTGLGGPPNVNLQARPLSPLSSDRHHQQQEQQQRQQQHQQRPGSRQGIADMTSWMDDFDSPLIKTRSDGDGKVLKLKFDVTQYEPEEIIVKTVDNKLQVHAKHEEKTDSRSVYREYNREFLLPEGVNPELIRSTLSRDGVLTVEAPLPQSLRDKARHIPIQKVSPGT